ncbi:MAG: hypothetical protein ACE5EB_08510 [Thermodesulfobacteriota bacterium]
MKKIFVVFCLLAVAGCAAETPVPDRDTAEAKVYRRVCSGCHSLPHPRRNTYRRWKHFVALMETRIEHREMKPMTPGERAAVLRYLKKHSR